jgi:hypothetical protein
VAFYHQVIIPPPESSPFPAKREGGVFEKGEGRVIEFFFEWAKGEQDFNIVLSGI